ELDDAEARAEMAARDGHRVDGLLAKFVGDLPDLVDLEPAQILRCLDGIEKGGLAVCGHGMVPVLQAGTCAPTRELHRFVAAAELDRPVLVARVEAWFQKKLKVAPDRS